MLGCPEAAAAGGAPKLALRAAQSCLAFGELTCRAIAADTLSIAVDVAAGQSQQRADLQTLDGSSVRKQPAATDWRQRRSQAHPNQDMVSHLLLAHPSRQQILSSRKRVEQGGSRTLSHASTPVALPLISFTSGGCCRGQGGSCAAGCKVPTGLDCISATGLQQSQRLNTVWWLRGAKPTGCRRT